MAARESRSPAATARHKLSIMRSTSVPGSSRAGALAGAGLRRGRVFLLTRVILRCG